MKLKTIKNGIVYNIVLLAYLINKKTLKIKFVNKYLKDKEYDLFNKI